MRPTQVTSKKLTVTIAGGGRGTVTGSGGLNCAASCTKLYQSGAKVTMTATPASGYAFSGWSSACGGTAACVVTMSADRSVTATFTSKAFTTALPGSYSGSATSSNGGQNVSLYVSSDGSQIQDVVLNTYLTCSPSAPAFNGNLHVASIPIQSDGSFSYTAMESGNYDNVAATFTYTFNGHFHGLNASGQQRLSGQVREDISYNNGASINCSSNVMPWSATRDASQGTQTLATPLAGSYSGSAYSNNGGQNVSFSVSSGGATIQNVVANTYLTCSPSAPAFDDHIEITAIPIQSDGSFTSSTMTTGVYDSTPATFTYTFNGHFHGLTTSGTQRVAGQLREDITYGSGTMITCSSNVMPWSATS
jgi:hypothetical protein